MVTADAGTDTGGATYRAWVEPERHVEQPDAEVDLRPQEPRQQDQPVAAWYAYYAYITSLHYI